MAKTKAIYNNFTRGEMSPRLRGRVDLSYYNHGCSILENMTVWSQGGATSRCGTRYVASGKNPADAVVLRPFVFSVDEAYVLEFGDKYLRFYRQGAQVLKGGTPYEVATPYDKADVSTIKMAQSADVLYLYHPDYWPRQIMRFGDSLWAIMKANMRDGPYFDENVTEVTVTPKFHGSGLNGRAICTDQANYIWIGGTAGTAVRSTDDTIFDTYTGPAKTVNSIACLNTYFIAVGNKGSIAQTGGTTWTSFSTGFAANFRGIVWTVGATKYVICADGGKIYTHAAPLSATAYTLQTTGVTDNLYAIAYRNNSGDELLAVGANGRTLRSADAVTWTAATIAGAKDLLACAWCNALSLWVVAGEDGKIYTSPDRITWTDRSLGVSRTLRGINASGSTIIVCGDDGIVLTSTDGITFTIRNIEFGLKLFSCCKRSSSLYMCSGEYGLMAVSTDTITWTIRHVRTAEITASDDLFDNQYQAIGRHFRWANVVGSDRFWGWGTILKYNNGDDFVVDVRRRSYDTTQPSSWETGAWAVGAFYGSEATASPVRNFPAAVGMYEQRMIAGGLPSHPQTVFTSRSGDWRDWSPTNWRARVPDDCAITENLASSDLNAILWLTSTQSIIAGTTNGPWKIQGADGSSAMSPLNFNAKKQVSYGMANIPPILAGNSIFYAQRYGRKIREMLYDSDQGQFLAHDMTKCCEHITKPSILEMWMTHDPDPIIWAVRSDGVLLALTYDRPEDIEAWARCPVGNGQALVESGCTIPGIGYDEVWLSLCVTVSGTAQRHIVRLYQTDYATDITDAYFVDDGVVYDGVSTSTITGLTHLEGKTVSVLADGVVQTPKTVSSGQITLDKAATKVSVGLPYTRKLKTMDLEGGDPRGTSQGDLKRVTRAVARLLDTGHARVGYDEDHTDPLKMIPGELFSGDKIIGMPRGTERNYYAYIESDKPLPLNVAAVVLDVDTSTGG